MRHSLAALCMFLALALPVQAEDEYIHVDWYPLLTDSVGWNITCGGISLGMVTALGSNAPDIDMARSFELSWLNVAGAKFNNGHGQRLSIALGIDWRNYRLHNDQMWVATDGSVAVTPCPDGASKRASRLKVFSLQLPVIGRQRVATKTDVFAGIIPCANLHASIVSRYTLGGEKTTISTTRHLHVVPLTLDFIAGVTWKKIGVYCRYSPCHVLRSDHAPIFTPLSAGLTLGL